MGPDELASFSAQCTRYGTSFDENVDHYCPPLVRIKNGNVAKRQPQVREMGTNYWKAQCSFRGLKTTGRVEELKDRIRNRDRSQDAAVKQEQDRIRGLLDAHYEKKALEDAERWWQDSSIKLELKVQSDAQRALKELLDRDPGIRNSAFVLQTRSNALTYWAQQFGLACQIVEPPQSMLAGMDDWLSWGSWSVVGRADLVQQQVDTLTRQASSEARAERDRVNSAREAKRVELQTQFDAFVDEAKRQEDWDLTGSWYVQCTELANYSSHQPETLSMEIYQDDYGLNDVRGLSRQNGTVPFPRFCATFEFGIVEGVMRIYPPESSRSSTVPFKVSSNPRFEYIWRGRETGEGEIQTTADAKVFPITFGLHGTTFEGTFECEYLQGVKIVGRKVSHGHGRRMGSEEKWRSLSERAWARECSSRW